MPFITQDRRTTIDESGLEALLEIQVGDMCYAYYKPMVEEWKDNPRWTTAHNIYKDMLLTTSLMGDYDAIAAYNLAWQVFFQLYVVPYELKKRSENGDI